MRLKGKVCLITGSSRGIGKATAVKFAANGASVVVNYRANENEANEVVLEIKRLGVKAIAVKADVSVPFEVKNMFKTALEEFGKIDVLVNNAGVDRPKPFLDLTLSDWEETFRVNLYGAFLCSQEAAKIMLERGGGKILNTVSVRGLSYCGRRGNIVYSASKAAMLSFTKTLAKELAPAIRVNGVSPGPSNTDISRVWDSETREAAINDSYLKRLVEPEDIANAFVFLASDESNAMTGEVIIVDGGYNLS